MAALSTDWANRFKQSLNRHSITDAARWACEYRQMSGDFAGPWTFNHHPWLKAMHESESPFNVGQKAAQMGFTEAMINIALFQMDVKKRDVLYLLPNSRPDATDFATGRIDKAISLSPHLATLFSNVNNTGHKQAGSTNLFIRGANAKTGLKSIPTGVIIFDEFDEMNQENISLAEERKSGQKFTLDWKISTPTTPDYGINALYETSTKEHWFFPCPCCSRHIELIFPDNLVITADEYNDPNIMNTHIICKECKNKLPHELKHEYISKGESIKERDSLTRGFHVNQLYSATLDPYKIAMLYLKSLLNPIDEQEFFNSKMGMPHIVAGAKITDEMLKELIKDYQMMDACRSNYVVTMGVDVGKVLHIHIDGWDLTKASPLDINAAAIAQTLWVGELRSFEELDQKMTDYAIKFCVIDRMPETKSSIAFAMRHYGRVRTCLYNPHVAARSLVTGRDGEDDILVSVHRTSWMDQALGRYRNRGIMLPNNLPRDYFEHIKAPVRRPTKNREGEPVYKYETANNKPDHYAHARTYSEIALPFAVGSGNFVSIKEKIH